MKKNFNNYIVLFVISWTIIVGLALLSAIYTEYQHKRYNV
jgi:hypothetical protein